MKNKINIQIFLSLLLIVGLNLVSAIDCGGDIQCNCGDNVVENFTLTEDITNCGWDGLNIGADNITLNCNNFMISRVYPEQNQYGISLNYIQGVTIRNCKITNFDSGIHLSASSNNYLHNNSIYNNGGDPSSSSPSGIMLDSSNNNLIKYNQVINNYAFGILLKNSNSNNLINNQISNNGVKGVLILDSDYNNLSNNLLENNLDGIRFTRGDYNIVKNNILTNNLGHGIYSEASSGNIIYRNLFEENGKNAYEEDLGNYWNLGNIGNYWDDFSKNSGFFKVYYIDGSGNGVDFHPIFLKYKISGPCLYGMLC